MQWITATVRLLVLVPKEILSLEEHGIPTWGSWTTFLAGLLRVSLMVDTWDRCSFQDSCSTSSQLLITRDKLWGHFIMRSRMMSGPPFDEGSIPNILTINSYFEYIYCNFTYFIMFVSHKYLHIEKLTNLYMIVILTSFRGPSDERLKSCIRV